MNRVKFYLEERTKGKSENLPIILSYWFNGTQFKYHTGIQVQKINYNKEYWKITDKHKRERQPIKANEAQAAALNTKLDQIKNKVWKLHNDAEALNLPLTKEYFREELDKTFKGKNTIEEVITVMKAWDNYLDFLQSERAETTYKKHRTARDHMATMMGSKFKSLKFADVNNKLVEQFRLWLVNREYKPKKKYQINTVAKYMDSFRDFLNWCKDDKRGYFNGKISYKVKEEDIEVIHLTPEEVKRLEQAVLENLTLDKVRDMYLFGCYTGMRYGDLYNLRKTDYKGDHISFTIGKGKKLTLQKVPLLPVPISIIEKYSEHPGDKLLPMFSNQKMNQYIKEVMKEAKINEPITEARKMGNGKIIETVREKWEMITFHSSRKSFITIAINKKMPESVIKSITGHSKDSRAFKKYYTISEGLKAEELVRVFTNPSDKLKAV